MAIGEKLGITPEPWDVYLYPSSTTIISKADKNHCVKILTIKKDPVVLKDTWDRQQRDHTLMSAAPEMLEALIRQAINFEENKNSLPRALWKSWNEYTIPIIEKATGKKWDKVKELCNEED